MGDLPVVNISGLFEGGDTGSIDQALGRALAVAGGFVVTGFPGAERLEERAARLLRFFQLSSDARRGAGTRPTNPASQNVYRGYTSLLGQDDFARAEWFDIGPSLPATPPRIRGAEVLAEANLWPEPEPYEGWCQDMQEHYDDLQATALAIILSAGRAVSVAKAGLEEVFTPANATLRLLNYPVPESRTEPVSYPVLAAERHTDGSGVSLLWQASPGLQVEGPDGVWRDVPQLPGSISVHLGDVLEMITDGAIRATPHRVLDHGGPRSSIGFFLEPAMSASMTGSGALKDTYAWRLLERLHSYPSMQELVPEPALL